MRLTIVALSLAVATGLGYESSPTIMEARIHFDGLRRLELLGNLAGELDVCTWEEDELWAAGLS